MSLLRTPSPIRSLLVGNVSSVILTHLNTSAVQLLHTYSLNAGDELRELLSSDHLFSTLLDVQSGQSNTLAAGLAQLLYDWKHMFGYESTDTCDSYLVSYITGWLCHPFGSSFDTVLIITMAPPPCGRRSVYLFPRDASDSVTKISHKTSFEGLQPCSHWHP